MKVKNLVIALGVTGAFVACSQENLVNENQNLNSDRPVVGAIDVKLSEGVESRWAYAGGFSFDENDYMGACLMDRVNDLSAETWAGKYTLVNTISTNYKYGYKDNWTNGDAIMSEGNYFFYLPYNSALKSRSGLTYKLAADQYAYDTTAETPVHDGNLSWIENQMFIGYDDIKAGDQQATPNLVEVFAKPRFNVNYIGSKDVKIERIVLMNEEQPFAVEGALAIEGSVGADYNALSKQNKANYQLTSTATASQVFSAYNQAIADVAAGDLELQEDEKILSPLAELGLLSISKTSPSLSLNVVPAKEVSALMVVPAGTKEASKMTIQLYTNVGWVVLSGITADVKTAAADTELTHKNIAKLYTLKSGDGVKADAVEINFGDKDIKVPATVTVATTSQLESVMRWYAVTEKDFELTVNIAAGANVELTSKVYNIINANANLTVKFVGGTLTIPATAAADAWSKIALSGTTSAVVNKGTQDIKNGGVDLTIGYTMTNEGVLNFTATNSKTLTLSADIVNKGDINVKAGTVNFATLDNNKNLTVDNGAVFVATTLNNNAVLKADNKNYENVALITNNGTMTFAGKNEVTIENNGKIYLNAFVNDYKEAVTTGAAAGRTNGYKGVINNNLTTSYVLAKATVENNSYIYNYGFVYSQNAGTITNNKYVKANDGSTTYITVNTAEGEIELEKRDTETTVNTNSGKMSYTLTAADLTNGVFKFDTTSDKFNTLRVGMNMKLTDAAYAPTNLILTGATVSCPTVLSATDPVIEAPKFISITVESGVNVIKGIEVKTAKLSVASGALLQIPSLSSFGAETVTNAGEILVGGKFFCALAAAPAGTFSSAGTGSYTWNWNGSTWN